MNKQLITNISIGLIALGAVGLFIGGGSEGYAIEIVSGSFTIIGIVITIFKKG